MSQNRWLMLARTTFAKWQRDECLSLGAGLAYYALFSFFPLILVILSVVGFVIDPATADVQQRIIDLIGSEQISALVSQTLTNLQASRGSAGLIGFATLILSASGIFGALDRAFDTIWELRRDPGEKRTLLATARDMVLQKLLAFALVLGCALLMLLSIVSTVAVTLISGYTDWLPGRGLLLQIVQFALSLGLLALAIMALLRYLPGRHVAWRDVWFAGIVSALLFTALQKAIGIYLSQSNYASYGAVGGVMALLIWIYLTSQIILLGGEISFAWARCFGRASDKAVGAG